MSDTQSSSGRVGFCGLLTILFIGLKLTGYIDWSWWWVLAPSWVTFAVVFVVLFVALVASAFESEKARARREVQNMREISRKRFEAGR